MQLMMQPPDHLDLKREPPLLPFDVLFAGVRDEYERLVATCRCLDAGSRLVVIDAGDIEHQRGIEHTSGATGSRLWGAFSPGAANGRAVARPCQPADHIPHDMDDDDDNGGWGINSLAKLSKGQRCNAAASGEWSSDDQIENREDGCCSSSEPLSPSRRGDSRTQLKDGVLVTRKKRPGSTVGFAREASPGPMEPSTPGSLMSPRKSRRTFTETSCLSADGLSLARPSGRRASSIVTNVDSMEKDAYARIDKLRAIFQKLDGDGDGLIAVAEIAGLLKHDGCQLSKAQLVASFKAVKHSGDDDDDDAASEQGLKAADEDLRLDFDEFAEIMLLSAESLKELPEVVAADLQVLRNIIIRSDAKDALEGFFAKAQTMNTSQAELDGKKMRHHEKLDAFMAFVIVVNTVTLGWGTDTDWEFIGILELVFNMLYLMELCLKLHALGVFEFFFGSDWKWHWFDATLCVFAAFDATLQIFAYAQGSGKESMPSYLRLVRLARLPRTVRLMRYRIFADLTLMVKGVAAGFRTLFWAIVLLFFVVYVFTLVFRQLLGDDIDDCLLGTSDACSVTAQTGLAKHLPAASIDQLFGSVPNAMFTIFRCVSGECVTPQGTPVLMALHDVYGAIFVIPYCLAFLFVTFGIFNLIVAIFVETVLEAARQKRRNAADQESLQVGLKLQRLLSKFLNVEDEDADSSSCWNVVLGRAQRLLSVDRRRDLKSRQANAEFDRKITRNVFVEVVRDQEVKSILDDLDIGSGDRADFFDVIDADGSGELDMQELIVGLMKLRGGADKSDVVAALLGVRALQQSLNGYMMEMNDNFNAVRSQQEEVAERLQGIEFMKAAEAGNEDWENSPCSRTSRTSRTS
eukprot:TRINITY_DN3222_c1_g3_i1.p1 TRINITY_DN3222_c1_g3~~TRINITY_DN3222_c1_g3_i1.p1  ORF type:complete len:859 (-),score=209.02 TRINITY_DN3222_c1_g3_i1:504-3080(-)